MASISTPDLLLWSPSYPSSSSSGSFEAISSSTPLVLSGKYCEQYDALAAPKESYGFAFPPAKLASDDASAVQPSLVFISSDTFACPSSSVYSSLGRIPSVIYPARPVHRSSSGLTLLGGRLPPWIRKRNKSLPPSTSPTCGPVGLSSNEARNHTKPAFTSSNRSVSFKIPANYKKVDQGRFNFVPSPHPQFRKRTISTATLASLAWTGHSSASASPSLHPNSSNATSFLLPLASSPSNESNERLPSLSSEHPSNDRMTAPRRPCHRRRWTLATAMADARVTDEVLIEGLEQIRLAEGTWERRFAYSPVSPQSPQSTEDSEASPGEDECIRVRIPHKLPLRSTSDPSSAQTWQLARRALLICREIIRTEQHYLTSLRILADGATKSPPPPVMLALLESLVQASQTLVTKMERNPSALGVAEAFVSCEVLIEGAFVSWCANVGEFFAPLAEGRVRMYPKSISQANLAGPLKRKFSAWKRSKATGSMINHDMMQRRTKFSVRDLAILPTQRVSRYVLLYKDLLRYTPHTSPSYKWARESVDSATKIAERCNAAQNHRMFLRAP